MGEPPLSGHVPGLDYSRNSCAQVEIDHVQISNATEVFQLAAQRLAVAPSNCVVIEDACAGIMAANTASMLSVALVSTGHTRDEYTKADYVIEQLSQISPELIETWIDVQG